MATHRVEYAALQTSAIELGLTPCATQLAETDAQRRCEAVWMLGRMRSPAIVPALRHALKDRDVEVRREVVWALARIGDDVALAALHEALGDRDREVRGMAAEAIEIIRRKSAARRQEATAT